MFAFPGEHANCYLCLQLPQPRRAARQLALIGREPRPRPPGRCQPWAPRGLAACGHRCRKSPAEAWGWVAGAALSGDALKPAHSQRQEEAIDDIAGFFSLRRNKCKPGHWQSSSAGKLNPVCCEVMRFRPWQWLRGQLFPCLTSACTDRKRAAGPTLSTLTEFQTRTASLAGKVSLRSVRAAVRNAIISLFCYCNCGH